MLVYQRVTVSICFCRHHELNSPDPRKCTDDSDAVCAAYEYLAHGAGKAPGRSGRTVGWLALVILN
jgi:hypothetical protein